MAIISSSLNRICPVGTLLLASVMVVASSGSVRAFDPFKEYDLDMLSRPGFPTPETKEVFPDGLKELWLKALKRPDAELQRITIDTIAVAHRRGMPGIADTQSQLVQVMVEAGQQLDVVQACARTLIVFDNQELEPSLIKMVEERGEALAEIVEPALIKWKSSAMKSDWLARLQDPAASDKMLIRAMDGLAVLKTQEAEDQLLKLCTTSGRSMAIRMRAASAMGALGSANIIEHATRMLSSQATPDPLRSILAIRLLRSNRDQAAIDLLVKLSNHSNTAVQSESLERLFSIDRSLVDAIADNLVSSNDVNVRRWGVRAMLNRPDANRIRAIAPLLDDSNPKLRRGVGGGLLIWSKKDPALKKAVLAEATRVLQQDSWRGCEQAIRLLAKLDHKPAGDRFVQLLSHDRDEVKVASAWGLKQLRVAEHLPAMLKHADKVYGLFKSGERTGDDRGLVLQMAHLFIAFGDQMYAPSEKLLRAYLPKTFEYGEEPRGAACWAIGLLKAKEAPPELVQILTERIRDTESMESELTIVRNMCAIAFGRMKAKSTLGDLRKYAVSSDSTSRCCYWAIEQITGEKPPAMKDYVSIVDDWFLAPLAPAQP